MLVNAALLSLLGGALAAPMINSPASLVQCQPIQLSWTGATSPVWISAIPGGEASGTPLKTWDKIDSGNTLTWVVDLPVGTSITIQLTDGTGAIAYTSPVSVLAGSSDECLKDGGSSSPGSPAPAPAAGGPAASPAAADKPADKPATPAAGAPAAASPSAGAASGPAPAAGSPSGATKPSTTAGAAPASNTTAAPAKADSGAGRNVAGIVGAALAAAIAIAAF